MKGGRGDVGMWGFDEIKERMNFVVLGYEQSTSDVRRCE